MSERETTTAWVTKYALTQGVLRFDGAEVCGDIDERMLKYGEYHFAHGRDWHRTEEAAVARAEEMRQAKIASLKKQIAKLEKLRFASDKVTR